MMASTKDKFQTNVQYILSIKFTVSIFIIKFTLTLSFIKLKNPLILGLLKMPAAKPLLFMGLNLDLILDIINLHLLSLFCMIYICSESMEECFSLKTGSFPLQNSCSLLMLSTNRILMSDIAAVVKILNQH